MITEHLQSILDVELDGEEEDENDDDDDGVYCTPDEAQVSNDGGGEHADVAEPPRQQHTEGQIQFHHHPVSGFPLPVNLDAKLERWSDKKRYDDLLRKAMTVTEPWPWRDADAMSASEWVQYARDLLTDPTLSMCITPWRRHKLQQEPTSYRLAAIELVLWLASLNCGRAAVACLVSRWFFQLSDTDPIERILRRSQACLYANSQWNKTYAMDNVPEWARVGATVIRDQKRPVRAMTELEFLCQLTHAVPNFIVSKLANVRERVVDVDFARHGIFTMVAQVASHNPNRTCSNNCIMYKIHSLEMLRGSGATAYHNIVASFTSGEGVLEGKVIAPVLSSVVVRKPKKRKRDENKFFAISQVPCGCCDMPIGRMLLAWIRCWLQPHMYIFETQPAFAVGTQPSPTSWHPHTLESLTHECEGAPPNTIVLTTISQLEHNTVQWVLTTTSKPDACSVEEKLRLCNDGFGLWFMARTEPSRIIPLVGFAPAYIALVAVRHLQLWTPLPDVLASIVYEYSNCNI